LIAQQMILFKKIICLDQRCSVSGDAWSRDAWSRDALVATLGAATL